MKKRRICLIFTSCVLLLSVLFGAVGCALSVSAESLMDGIEARSVTPLSDLKSKNAATTDFAVRLFGETFNKEENTLISPISVLCALAMTANGAEGNTLSEMESALGMTREELNNYVYTYMGSLSTSDKYKLSLANSIWFTDDDAFSVNTDFLQTNADYFGADIYKAPFDNSTLRDINRWVKNSTDGMIPNILDRIPDEAVMYLVNALAFEAEWAEIYEKSQVRDGSFTTESGEVQTVDMMYSSEGKYLSDGMATGFMKYYSGRKYAFVALLPNEGVTVEEYVGSLDGESLNNMLSSAESRTVEVSVPKFEVEYDIEMSDTLKSMGISDAFDAASANFESLGSYESENIYISRVLHKTYISVGERGTKAGAVTVIEMECGSAAPPQEIKRVYLDRPFVYMLVDCENNIPFFIGAFMSAK